MAGPKMCLDNLAIQTKILRLALGLNLIMFGVGLAAGLVAHSSALIADSLDMLADAAAYAVALMAQRRNAAFKVAAARASGYVLVVLGCAVLIDIVRRAVFVTPADGTVMTVVACLSLATNFYVLRKLGTIKSDGVHLHATWIFTRVDIIVNFCVLLTGFVVRMTGFDYLDLIVGAGISIYILTEAREIFAEAQHSEKER